jgi:hypothetical protein
MQVCQSCFSTTMLCGTTGFDLVCCSYSCCSGVCSYLATDPNNCGACGNVCPADAPYCLRGACAACPSPGEVVCPTGCADLATDPNNCGACGNVCPADTPYCVGGGACSPTVVTCCHYVRYVRYAGPERAVLCIAAGEQCLGSPTIGGHVYQLTGSQEVADCTQCHT